MHTAAAASNSNCTTTPGRIAGRTPSTAASTAPRWARVAGAALLSALIVFGVTLPIGALTGADVAADGSDGASTVQAAPATFSPHVASFPDEIGTEAGGVAARLHVGGEAAVPGELFALFATNGSDDEARLYDATAYTLVRTDVHPDMVASNEVAVDVVSGILDGVLDREMSPLEFTSAPAGGYSAGLTFAIGYLNEVSDGAFTGDARVASTGTLDSDGYVDWVTAIDEKTAAAHLAGVDVMFTSATPAFFTVDSYGARFEGDLHGARRTGVELASERNWASYEQLGAGRPSGGMDIVAVAHLGDVAAYLCGAGSDFACDVRTAMADTTVETVATIARLARRPSRLPQRRSSRPERPARLHRLAASPPGDPKPGGRRVDIDHAWRRAAQGRHSAAPGCTGRHGEGREWAVGSTWEPASRAPLHLPTWGNGGVSRCFRSEPGPAGLRRRVVGAPVARWCGCCRRAE